MELRAETSVFDDKLLKEDIDNAQETADNAQVIAGTTAQYFWFLEEIGSVPAGVGTGAHITNKTKEEFLNNPANGGGNLLARSNGIAIRDGLTELAYFSGTAAQIGKSNSYNSYFDTQSFQIRNGSTLLSKFTSNGTDIYLANDSVNSIASFGTTARIGKAASGHALVKSDGLHVWTGAESTATNEVAFFGATARIGATNQTNIYINPSGTDSGIKFRTNGNGIIGLTIADIGFDSTAGWTSPENWPKGTWYTFGYRTGAKGYYSFVSGFNNIASHNASVAFGIENKVYAPMAMAIGSSNTIGNNSNASSVTDYNDTIYTPSCNSSLAVGWGLKVTAAQQVVTGYYNATVSDAQLIIGNGANDSTRKNSFVVYRTGNVVASGSMTVSGHSTPIGSTLTTSQTSARGSGTDLGDLSNAFIDIPAGTWVITLNCRGDLNSSGKRLQFEFYNSTDSTEYTSTRVTCHSSNTGTIGGMSVLVVYASKTTRFYCRCYQNSGASVDLTAAFRAVRIA